MTPRQYKCGERLLKLAKPKSYDDNYIPDRNVCNIITPAVLSASCTGRIQALAKPKKYISADHHYIDSRHPEDPITQVSRQARMHQVWILNYYVFALKLGVVEIFEISFKILEKGF